MKFMKKLIIKYIKWAIPLSISFSSYLLLITTFKNNYDNYLKAITIILCLFLPVLFEQWHKRLKEIEGDYID